MSDSDKFIQASLRERWALAKIIEQLKTSTEDKVYYTDPYLYDSWDAIMYCENPKKIYIIEVKLRSKIYDKYFYELKKHKQLMKKKKEVETSLNGWNIPVEILYINFTPITTYIWNISEVLKFSLKKIIPCNEYSVVENKVKVNKDVYELENQLATQVVQWIFNEQEYYLSNKPKEVIKKIKGIQF